MNIVPIKMNFTADLFDNIRNICGKNTSERLTSRIFSTIWDKSNVAVGTDTAGASWYNIYHSINEKLIQRERSTWYVLGSGRFIFIFSE